MKVLLLKDVYKLGRAGDVKKVAAGYGRNFLLPQKLAVLATPGALKQAEHIKKIAAEQRALINEELSSVAERLDGVELTFPMKAGETGRLYGSVTTSMVAEALKEQTGTDVDRRQIESQPIKLLGVHEAIVRLTVDLLPEIKIIVHREGEPPESVLEEEIPRDDVPTEAFADLQAELDAMEADVEEEEADFAPEMEASDGMMDGEAEIRLDESQEEREDLPVDQAEMEALEAPTASETEDMKEALDEEGVPDESEASISGEENTELAE